MLLSYVVPCHKREDDLMAAWPSVLVAAAQSPPVELVVVDYANEAYLSDRLLQMLSMPGVSRVVPRVKGTCFKTAHARNVGFKAAQGDYICRQDADVKLHPSFFAHIRERIEATKADLLIPSPNYHGLICVKRELILKVGGYDERMEFYGPEDKDLAARLRRATTAVSTYDSGLLNLTRTPNEQKVANYRLPLNKKQMHEHGLVFFRENDAANKITVNEGQAWGAW